MPEKLTAKRTHRNKVQFLVKWAGFPDDKDDTWEPQINLSGYAKMVEDYLAKGGVA